MPALLRYLIRWLLLSALVAAAAGTASALFLASLAAVTSWRESHLWIIALLPVAGFGVGLLYHVFGREVESGSSLLLEEIHEPRHRIPFRMSPFILLGTLLSHLFGASVGREGTALQMGGALADQFTSLFRLKDEDRRRLLMAGLAAGFASVFGTPLAGAIFALEVPLRGRFRGGALFPCLLSALLADQVTLAWGLQHSVYVIPQIPTFGLAGLFAAAIAGAIFGLAARLFTGTTRFLTARFASLIPFAPFRPLLGGVLVAGAVWMLGSTKYIGLGLPTMQDAFTTPLAPWDFAGKLVFTALSLGAGFKGGEVTPLFFIGAALGNALSPVLPLPQGLLAGLGFVGVFAGAACAPLASTLMALELFGPGPAIFAGLACAVSRLCAGPHGIYGPRGMRPDAPVQPIPPSAV